MKFRVYGMVLSLLFALGLVFSFGMDASASHGSAGIAAGDVDPTVEAEVEAFLDHIIDYYDQVVADNASDNDALSRELTIYGRALRQEGDYKHSATNMYSMGINASGILTNHAGYPNLFGYEFDQDAAGSAVGSTIQALIDGSGVGSAECEPYGDQGRVACATKVSSPTGDITVIAGLHHAEDDSAFSLPDCSDFTLTITAQQVFQSQDDADLEAYVKAAIGVVQRQVRDASTAQFMAFLAGGGSLSDLGDQTSPAAIALAQGILQRVYSKAACIGAGDFKHGNIYAFIMSADPAAASVLFNGNNFDLNGATLELNDDQLPGDDKSITGLFARALEGTTSNYVNYRWDDPTTDEDNVPDFFENRKVPGTSCKRSYIEVADINALLPDTPVETPEALYIFGSGTYPGDEVCASGEGDDMPEMPESDDDDGCAIAGTGHTSQSALLNLFLIASVLFSVVFLRRRV